MIVKLIYYKLLIKIIKLIFFKNIPKFIAPFLTEVEYKFFFLSLSDNKFDYDRRDNKVSKILNDLETNGYSIIENYFSKDDCQKIIREIDSFIDNYPDLIFKNEPYDQRIFGAENFSNNIKNFYSDKNLSKLATIYNKKDTKACFTLAAKINSLKGNEGSGGGWHRDGFFRQFKTLLYLSDVCNKNGPFQIILNSHKLKSYLSDIKKGNLGYMQYRISNNEVNKILNKNNKRLKTFNAKAGTLILFDTTTIHRGCPLESGSRYALTNYFYVQDQISDALYKKFKVLTKNYIQKK